MAISGSYTTNMAWFAESLSGLNVPAGGTKQTVGSVGDPTLGGTGDDLYATFDATTGSGDGLRITPSTALTEPGTGDFTIAMKCRFNASNSDSSCVFFRCSSANTLGTSDTDLAIEWQSTGSQQDEIRLIFPDRSATFEAECPEGFASADTDFILIISRNSATWEMWGSGTAGTPTALTLQGNSGENSSITELGDVYFGCDEAGGSLMDGRVYWVIMLNEAIQGSDGTDADWTNTGTLKSLFGAGGGGSSALPLLNAYYHG